VSLIAGLDAVVRGKIPSPYRNSNPRSSRVEYCNNTKQLLIMFGKLLQGL